MEYLWNNIELPMPPLKTVPVKKIKFDLFKLRRILQDAIDFLECQINFNENALLCSKLIMKRKNSFKHFKGFQDMCKAKGSLNRLAQINLPNSLKNFIGLLPESMFSLELPPRANLNYLLLRIIGYYKVLTRITSCCKYSVAYFVRILRNNFFFDTLSLFLSVLSKIWYDGNIILKFTAKLYTNLKNFLQYMPPNNIKYDFDDFIYPDKLYNDMDTIENLNEKQNEEQNIQKPIFTMKEKQKPAENISSTTNNQSSTDIGEVISRDALLVSNNIKKNVKAVKVKSPNPTSNVIAKKIKSKKISEAKTENIENLSNAQQIPTEKCILLKETKRMKKGNKEKTVKNSKNPPKFQEESLDEISKEINKIKTITEIKTFFCNEDAKRKQSKNSLFAKNISKKEWSKFKKIILCKAECEKEKRCVKIFKKFLNKKIMLS